jgi:hypothetical protein
MRLLREETRDKRQETRDKRQETIFGTINDAKYARLAVVLCDVTMCNLLYTVTAGTVL